MSAGGLRERLGRAEAVLAPGCYDVLTALLIEQAGFEAAYLSGASIAYTQLGRPDIGLVSFDHVADVVARIAERVALPLIVDADTGFGNAMNVMRTMQVFERMGAAAVQFEDQTMPKRCGHLAGKTLIGAPEMVGKIRAAVDARRHQATLVVARTDAIAVEGLAQAIDRASLYAEAGADVIFVEAPRTVPEMRAIVAALPGTPLVANMVEGGATPIQSCAALSEIGFRLVICPGATARVVIPAVEAFLRNLKENGTTAGHAAHMTDLAGVNRRIGLEALLAEGVAYDPA